MNLDQVPDSASFVATLYPPLVVTSMFAWPEPVLPVLVLAAAVAVAAVVTAARRRTAVLWALACGACAGALYPTHGRTAPLVALLVALLLGLAAVRRELAVGAAGLAGTAVVAGAGARLNQWLAARSWGPRADGDLQRVLDNARDVRSLPNVAALGVGQYWYLFVATFGLAVLGIVQAGTALTPGRATRGSWLPAAASRDSAGTPVVAVFLLGSLVTMVVLVGLFLRPPTRPDHVVYGRYAEILVPPFLALGLVRLWTVRFRRLVLELAVGTAVAVAAALAVLGYADGLVTHSPVNWYTVLALPPLTQARDQIQPVAGTAVALAGIAVLLAATRLSRRLGAAGLAAVLVGCSVALGVVLGQAKDRAFYGTQPVPLSQVEGIRSAREVGYDLAAATPIGLYGYQWQLDRAHFVLFDSRRDPAPRTTWVIAGTDWPQAAQVGARRVWVHSAFGQAVWRLPAP
jgi:hypothetical protein